MTAKEYPHPLRRAPLFTPYVVIWSMCGVLSLGVLMVLGLAPEWVDDLKTATITNEPQSIQSQRATVHLAGDITALKESVAQVQLDLAKVKTDVVANGEEQKAISAQVTSLEARMAAAQPETKIDTVAPSTATAPADAAPVPPASPARIPKVINAEKAATAPALETGSVNQQAKPSSDAISFGPAVVKPAPKPVGIKLSSGASIDSLRLSWSVLSENYGDALKNLEPRYRSAGNEQNPMFDLVAGPIKSKAEAAKVCKALTAQGATCSVGAFAGEAL